MNFDIRSELVLLLPRLRRFAYALSGSLDEADDLVQEACERALSRQHQFEPGTRLDSWLFRIIQTIWLGRLRKVRRRPMVYDAAIFEQLGFDARIAEQTEARMDLSIVLTEFEKMPAEQREVLVLVTIDGQSYKDAADTLGIPIGTVMSRLARARRRLAEALQRSPAPTTEQKP